jgi:integrase
VALRSVRYRASSRASASRISLSGFGPPPGIFRGATISSQHFVLSGELLTTICLTIFSRRHDCPALVSPWPPSAGKLTSPFVFDSERGAPLSAPGFSRMVERAAISADLGIKAHAHMLRHACGYKLANDGHDTRAIQAYLGHRNIQNTTRYTALAPQRFKEFFRD